MNFEDYFTNESIVRILINSRAKIAYQRHKTHMMAEISKKISLKSSEDDSELLLLDSLFPPRRKWKKLSESERHGPRAINSSLERNKRRLWLSYISENGKEKKGLRSETWYLNLTRFCEKIRAKTEAISIGYECFFEPLIIPLFKEIKDGKHIYRPITRYCLEDKVISTLTAKYLTITFDRLFIDCSYAFRAKKRDHIPTHHDAVKNILSYRRNNPKIWVAECDIQKFFDTVQHNHLIKVFKKNILALQDQGVIVSEKAIMIFTCFLNSYSYNKNVLSKNQTENYFQHKKGMFSWVEEELLSKFGNTYVGIYKIGIPQGNAISCFIANLILDNVDKSVTGYNEQSLYVRYCDDMILGHPDKEVCESALEIYKRGIEENFLLYHSPEPSNDYLNQPKKFWKNKSKEPYLWGNKYEGLNNVPWLSFVGYHINYKGLVRVRKSSLEKEIKKQIQETKKVLQVLGIKRNEENEDIHKHARKSKKQLLFSLQQRLISMSIGRTNIYNYNREDHIPGLCWINGFKNLNDNPIAKRQMKMLDSSQQRQIAYLKKEIALLEKDVKKPQELPKYMENLYYGYPYSYCGSLEKPK